MPGNASVEAIPNSIHRNTHWICWNIWSTPTYTQTAEVRPVPGGVHLACECVIDRLLEALNAGKCTRCANIEFATGIKLSVLYDTGTCFHCNSDTAISVISSVGAIQCCGFFVRNSLTLDHNLWIVQRFNPSAIQVLVTYWCLVRWFKFRQDNLAVDDGLCPIYVWLLSLSHDGSTFLCCFGVSYVSQFMLQSKWISYWNNHILKPWIIHSLLWNCFHYP